MSKNALNDGTKHIGIIAQEVQSGSLGKWAISTGPDGYLRYDPSAVIYSLVNSIKALDKKKANMSGSGIILGGATANVFAPDMTNINTTLTDLSSQISLLSGALSEYYTRISAIEQAQVII